MEILIPVTKVTKLQKQGENHPYSQIHPQGLNAGDDIIFFKPQDNKQLHIKVQNPCEGRVDAQNQQFNDLKRSLVHPHINQKESQHTPNTQRIKLQKEQHELQKKSTKQSLSHQFQSNPSKKSVTISDDHELSALKLNTTFPPLEKKQSLDSVSKVLCTQNDILQNDGTPCKICLQTTQELTYDKVSNPICRVCECKDYVHLNCLQQWITHRDILNEEIHSDQCEVCLASYQIQMVLETFLSLQTLGKSFSHEKLKVFCKFMPALVFLLLTLFCLYVLIVLVVQIDNGGGVVREILLMPFGTCVTIAVFLMLIVGLVFGIFLYTWIMEFSVDFRYKIRVLNEQKGNTKFHNVFHTSK